MTNKKIKILHLFYLIGGVGTSIELIAKNTSNDEFEHVIINGAPKADIPLADHQFKIYHLKLDRDIKPIKDLQLVF